MADVTSDILKDVALLLADYEFLIIKRDQHIHKSDAWKHFDREAWLRMYKLKGIREILGGEDNGKEDQEETG